MRLAVVTVPSMLFCLIGVPALAGQAEDLAKARIRSIASGDVGAVDAAYGSSSALEWVGGPLDGRYATPDELHQVWQKFTGAQGQQKATIAGISEAASPKGSTVVADVTFVGKNTVRVRYVLTYRDDKLVNEVWQVNPKAAH